MSVENSSVEGQLQFIEKIRDKVKETEMEPVWERLYALLSKISSLSNAEKEVINATIKKLVEKIENFKIISQRQLEKVENDKCQQSELSSSIDQVQNESTLKSIKNNRKPKKLKRWRRSNEFSHVAMSPRRDHIPILRIRLAEIYKTKRQKEEKKKNKKMKEALRKITEEYIESNSELPNDSAILEDKNRENILQNIEDNESVIETDLNKSIVQPQEASQAAEMPKVLIQNNKPEYNLKECYVSIDRYLGNSKTALNVVNVRHEHIPIEKSKSNKSSNRGIQTMIIDDSDNEIMDNISCISDACTFNDSVQVESSKESSPNDEGSSSVKNNTIALSDASVIATKNSKRKTIITPKKLNFLPEKSTSSTSKHANNTTKLESSSKLASPKSSKISGIQKRHSSVLDDSKSESIATQLEINSPKSNSKNSGKLLYPKLLEISINTAPKKSNIQTRRSSVLNVSRVDSAAVQSKLVGMNKADENRSDHSKISPVSTQRNSLPQQKPQTRRGSVTRNESQPSIDLQSTKTSKSSTNRSESVDSLAKELIISDNLDKSHFAPQKSKDLIHPAAVHIIARKSISQIRNPTTTDVTIRNSESSVDKKTTTSFKRPLQIPSNQANPSKKTTTRKSTSSTNRDKIVTTPPNKTKAPIPHGCINSHNNEQIDLAENSPAASTSSNQISGHQFLFSKIKDETPEGYMSPPMTEIPTQAVLQNAPKDRKMILLDPELTLRKIRPWLQKSEHRKYLKNCEQMLGNGYCLSAMFKCMGSSCSYFTDNPDLFLKHLILHHKYQKADIKNYSQCSYCNFLDDDCKKLVEHISSTHGNNRFQCTYCFYRSYDFHIYSHYKLFHALKPEIIIECKPLTTMNEKTELSEVWKNFYSVCRPIICALCKSKFYNIKHFENHYKSYDFVPSSRCIKCKFEINKETVTDHLKNCHGFGDFNCAFCSYGSDSTDSIKIHISSHHTNKPLLYFDRSVELSSFPKTGSTSKEVLSKMLVLKQLVQPKTANMKNIKIFNNCKELENAHNINSGILNT